MSEVIAASIGAIVSIFLFTLSIVINRKEKDTRALFKKVSILEQRVSTLEGSGRNRNWRSK